MAKDSTEGTARSKQVVTRIIAILGGPVRASECLGISPQAISQWNRVPAHRVIELERMINGIVKRHEMRPDLYPVPVEETQ